VRPLTSEKDKPATAGPVAGTRRKRRPLRAPDAKRLAEALSISIRSVRPLDSGGKLPPPVRLSGRVVWPVVSIRAWPPAGAPDRAGWEPMNEAQTRRRQARGGHHPWPM
jgi:hypothetical protein